MDGKGWRRLAQITNDKLDKSRLHVSRCAIQESPHFILSMTLILKTYNKGLQCVQSAAAT